jgi:hypothetical protein
MAGLQDTSCIAVRKDMHMIDKLRIRTIYWETLQLCLYRVGREIFCLEILALGRLAYGNRFSFSYSSSE